MKKIKRCIVLMSIIATLLASTQVVSANGAKETKEANEAKGQVVELTCAEFMNKVDANDDFYIYVGKPTCPACQAFQPKIDEYMQTSTNTLFHYNTSLKGDRYQDVKTFFKNNQVYYIPSILHVSNGKVEKLYSVYNDEEFQEFKADFEQVPEVVEE